MNKSLDYRRDNRSEEQFKADILAGTRREGILVGLWADLMRSRGHTVSVKDNGIDNTGKLLPKSDNKADFLITVNGVESKVEVKRNEWDHKQTFKKYDIESYIKTNTKILLFFNVGKGDQPSNESLWTFIEVDKLKLMLEQVRCFSSDKKWGNKPILRIYPKDYTKYFSTIERLFNE